MWARLMREEFGASDEAARSASTRRPAGSTLTAQQPLNNVVRVTVQALSAVLGGTQSLHTNGYDEALSLPTAEAATLALRTQQVLAHESGVADTVDPLAGSYFVESLTSAVEEKARAYLDRIEEMGGASRAIEFMQEEVHRAAYEHQLAVESGDRVVVGVNRFTGKEAPLDLGQPDFGALELSQRDKLARFRDARDADEVHARLSALREHAAGSENLMPHLIDAVKAGVTLGEISDTFREVWGAYRPG
jgi:methylmalonyl-CoA mutase, N-terminal domain